jgi:hypothetical protein
VVPLFVVEGDERIEDGTVAKDTEWEGEVDDDGWNKIAVDDSICLVDVGSEFTPDDQGGGTLSKAGMLGLVAHGNFGIYQE